MLQEATALNLADCHENESFRLPCSGQSGIIGDQRRPKTTTLPFQMEEPAMKNGTAKKQQSCRLSCKLLLGIVTLSVVALGSAPTASAGGPPTALTESGLVIGLRSGAMNEFLGVPYAAPPLEALRWRPPRRYGFFPGFILQAKQFGSECTQAGGGSEDCLFLNVYTPSSDSGYGGTNGLPVMVWIHGGGLISGSSSDYDPVRLVKQGVIVVTFNYRLGYLGFLAQSAIDAENHLKGNYGLMDQQFVLNWVRRNIAGFGGDPLRVTIFGESAGGQSVYAQLASPLAAGLFGGAIAESGSYVEFQDYFSYIVTLAQAETTGTAAVPSGAAIADSVGCTNQKASCLRAVPAATMIAHQPSPAIYPFLDGTLLTQTIGAAFASGDFNQVPVISGTNHDEWRLFVALDYDLAGNPILTSTEYDAAVAALWGPDIGPPVLALYSYASYPSGGEALGASGTDGIFSCPARNAGRLLSQFVTTYAYEFNDENAPPAQSFFGGLLTFPLGAYHGSEVQYLFKDADIFGPQPLSHEQQELSEAMVGYWTEFAKTGNPNSSGEPAWAPYSASVDQFQSFIPPTPVVESNFDAMHLCSAFWDTF